MSNIKLGEMNELALAVQASQYKEDFAKEIEIEIEIEIKNKKISYINSNETAKREMATELMLQGFSEAAICRILNITSDQIPEPLPF